MKSNLYNKPGQYNHHRGLDSRSNSPLFHFHLLAIYHLIMSYIITPMQLANKISHLGLFRGLSERGLSDERPLSET